MKTTGRSPFTHGMEIEQFTDGLPAEVLNYTMNNEEGVLDGWHWDASGPRETSVGPVKNVKSILNKFFADTRDVGITWDWHASDGRGRGAGSHVHLCVAPDLFEDQATAWTIAYNTVIEVTPFLAPFFCHNWQDGFRDGARQGSRGRIIGYWATPTITRFRQETVQERIDYPSRYDRTFDSVTFNPADGPKPLTIELRLNDAHPAMALNGLLLLRRVAGQAIEGGWSPKLVNHDATLRACYAQIYERACEVGLLAAMKEPLEGGIRFQEGRGLPRVDRLEFDSMWDVLRAIMVANPQTQGSWRIRGFELIRDGSDEYGPQNNVENLWNIDAPRDEFEWNHGPDADADAQAEAVN